MIKMNWCGLFEVVEGDSDGGSIDLEKQAEQFEIEEAKRRAAVAEAAALIKAKAKSKITAN